MHRKALDPAEQEGMELGASRCIEPLETFTRGAQETTKKKEVVFCSGLLLDPSSYVILAACRNNQLAQEVVLTGSAVHRGRLSYWLIRELTKAAQQSVSFREVMERVLGKFKSAETGDQQPYFEGAVDRHLFARTESPFVRHTMARVEDAVEERWNSRAHSLATQRRCCCARGRRSCHGAEDFRVPRRDSER